MTNRHANSALSDRDNNREPYFAPFMIHFFLPLPHLNLSLTSFLNSLWYLFGSHWFMGIIRALICVDSSSVWELWYYFCFWKLSFNKLYFLKQKSRRVKLFYPFANYFNVWHNRRQLVSHIWFCHQSAVDTLF
jgi:hypothetical protein